MGSHGARLQFGQQGQRVHVETLELRTRRARCGQIGHCPQECQGPSDDYAKRRQDMQAPSSAFSVKT